LGLGVLGLQRRGDDLFGWSMGYFGGIALLVIILVGFVLGGSHGMAGLLHIPKAGGLYVRLAMLVAAAWAVGFSIPVFFAVKVPPPAAEVAAERTGFFASYGVLFRNIRGLWRASPNTTGTAARTSWGILGILVVILVGLAVLLPVKPGQTLPTPMLEDTAA
jgi:hypothetical protein